VKIYVKINVLEGWSNLPDQRQASRGMELRWVTSRPTQKPPEQFSGGTSPSVPNWCNPPCCVQSRPPDKEHGKLIPCYCYFQILLDREELAAVAHLFIIRQGCQEVHRRFVVLGPCGDGIGISRIVPALTKSGAVTLHPAF
jgi:hypothetical protein